MKTAAEQPVLSKKPSRNDALEAIDFIINVLKEHEKDLDRLITELAKITEQLGDSGEISDKIDKIEDRLTTIQAEVANLITYLSAPKAAALPTPAAPTPAPTAAPPPTAPAYAPLGPIVIVKCRNWVDFKTLSKNPETISYTFQETENAFQVDALIQGKVLTYNGELPQNTTMLKAWLSKQLNISEEKIFEGVLAVR